MYIFFCFWRNYFWIIYVAFRLFFFSFFKKAPTDSEFVTWADRLVFDRRAQRKWKCPPRKFTLWELCTYLLTTAVQKPRTLNSQGSLASPVRHWDIGGPSSILVTNCWRWSITIIFPPNPPFLNDPPPINRLIPYYYSTQLNSEWVSVDL